MSLRIKNGIYYVRDLDNDEKNILDFLCRFIELAKTNAGLKRLHETLRRVLNRIESGDPPSRESDLEINNPEESPMSFEEGYKKWLEKMKTPEIALKMASFAVGDYGSSLKDTMYGLPRNINPFWSGQNTQVSEDECLKQLGERLDFSDSIMDAFYQDERLIGWMMKADVEAILKGLGIEELEADKAKDYREWFGSKRKAATEAEWVVDGLRAALAEVSPIFRLEQERRKEAKIADHEELSERKHCAF